MVDERFDLSRALVLRFTWLLALAQNWNNFLPMPSQVKLSSTINFWSENPASIKVIVKANR